MYTDVLAKIPPSTHGSAQIVHDTPGFMDRMNGALNGQPLNRDKYARLLIGNRLYMTDAEFERKTNAEFMREAHGDVLIAGLGIGLILDPLFARCKSVTVIEKNADVIALIAPHYPQATVIHGDILSWEPPAGSSWDTIYFDIWPGISSSDVAEGRKLERRFKKYLREDGYMQSWSRVALKSIPRSRR